LLLLVCFCVIGNVSADCRQSDHVSQLIDQLNGADFRARVSAATALGEIKDPRAVEPLIAALNNPNEDLDFRRAAAEALGEIKDPRAIEPLIAVLEDTDSFLRWRAARALSETAAKVSDSRTRTIVVEALRKMGDPQAAEPLIAAVTGHEQLDRVSELINQLKDTDFSKRASAATQLGFGDKDYQGQDDDHRAVEPLIAALKDSNSDVRSSAVRALGELKDSRAVAPLIATLNDSDRHVRSGAAQALGKLKDRRTVEPLIAALKDSDWEVRSDAARSLGEIADSRAVESLIAALKDWSGGVRMSAANALGEIGDRRAVASLTATLKDSDSQIRGTALGALSRINNPRSVKPIIVAAKSLLDDLFGRSYALSALESISDARAVPLLVENLTDWFNGRGVAAALARHGWSPTTPQEQVHLWIAQRDKVKLLFNYGDMTKPVLLNDITSPIKRISANALYAGIGLGSADFISDAIATLNSRGSVEMANAFLNSGQADLQRAAETWATSRGYRVTTGGGNAPVTWGHM
jgi:HEAT repeat protein